MATLVTTSATKTIPFVQEPPILGSLIPYSRKRLQFYKDLTRDLGDVAGFHLGPMPIIVFNRPEYAQTILVEKGKNFFRGRHIQKAFRPFAGNGLFLSEKEEHRKQRKMMASAFQPRSIMQYADVMVDYTVQHQAGLQDGEVVNILQQMETLVLRIVGKVLFDSEVSSRQGDFFHALEVSTEYVNHVMSTPFSTPLSWPTPLNRRARAAFQLLELRLREMINEQRANPNLKEQHNFLALLLNARDDDGQPMSDQQIVDEAKNLFGGGNETTPTAVVWTLYELAQKPELYQKMLTEVDTVLKGRAPTYADLKALPYCLQVLKEGMRIYPPAYIILREALEDVRIGDYLVPRGSVAFVSPYMLHRIPEYYPDPEVFDPERFAPEREKSLPTYAYLPFGAGARVCIGNHFALMEMHLIMATLAQHVRFELVPGQSILPDTSKGIAMRPDKPIMMHVRRR